MNQSIDKIIDCLKNGEIGVANYEGFDILVYFSQDGIFRIRFKDESKILRDDPLEDKRHLKQVLKKYNFSLTEKQ